MKVETIGHRIKRCRTEIGLTQKQVSSAVGVSAGCVTQWELGYTLPKGKHLIALGKTLRCSPDWLLSGYKGGRTKSHKSNIEIDVEYAELQDDAKSNLGQTVDLPFFTEVRLSAGNGSTEVQEDQSRRIRFFKHTLRNLGVNPACAVCAKIKGNSMEPVLLDNSVVGIDREQQNIVDGKMFAIDHDGMLRVKIMYRLPGGGVRLKSFNHDEYPDEIYSAKEAQKIKIIGKIFWYSVMIS